MTTRIALGVEYNGARFSGWQRQSEHPSVQGAIEASNVQPVVEMTRLMAIQQAYERALKLVSSEDDLTRDMLRRIGDTSA